MNLKKIISCYHHGFAGGSKISSQLMQHLAINSYDIDAFFFEMPDYFTYNQPNIGVHLLNQETTVSEVIDSAYLKNYALTNKIIEYVPLANNITLYGANLFPYANILLEVKAQLTTLNPNLIVNPVGSDIFCIGPTMKQRVKWLLDNQLVNVLTTYSQQFAEEIQDFYGIKKQFHILPPIFNKEQFYPIGNIAKAARRKELGWEEEDFIIHHHSSMRHIKCPEIVISVALKATSIISRKCILVLAGIIPFQVLEEMGLALIPLQQSNIFKYKTQKGNLTIYWTGVISNVAYLMQIADVELNCSLHDSFNLSLMEAMGCGIPVVTSSVVGIHPHIKKSGGGFCFPTKRLQFDELNKVLKANDSKAYLFDIDYAIDALVGIANNPVASQAMGAKGAAYVVDEFNPNKIIAIFNLIAQ